jgi:hypothetical protein
MRGKRTALITLLLVALLPVVVACLWLRARQRQYALNQQLIAALVKGDDRQALALVNAGADPNTNCKPNPVPSLSEFAQQIWHRSASPPEGCPTALLIACGSFWNNDDTTIETQRTRPDAPQLVLAMLQHRAHINAQDYEQSTALVCAARDHRCNVVGVLLRSGANPNSTDWDGETPLMYAGRFEAGRDTVDLLLGHQGEVNKQDKSGKTALYFAVLNARQKTNCKSITETILALLAHRANPNLADKQGRTPLMVARRIKRPDLIALLKHFGAR